ncbi:threonine dehydrogenase [Bacillus sp. JCM 19045]|nr:threonine dehydrogenase [Bacillus sp. JCM 19045]
MKVGIYEAPETVSCQQREVPTLHEGEALIRVSYAGICGTDMMIYSGRHPRAKAPLILGHEFAGTIESIQDKASTFKAGERVVIEPLITCGTCKPCQRGDQHVCSSLRYIGIDRDGGFAEFVTVPIGRLRRVPDEVSDQEAAMIEPLAVAIHTVKKSSIQVGDTVAILGAGPIGLLIGLIAQQAGASAIYISDMSAYRLQVAQSMGFQAVHAGEADIVEVVKQETNGEGADVVFEVAGSQITANQMIDAIKTQGEMVVVSVYKTAPTIDLAKMHFRELSIRTTRCFSEDDFVKAIRMLKHKQVNVMPLISHVLSLDHIEDAFNHMNNPNSSLKVLVHP